MLNWKKPKAKKGKDLFWGLPTGKGSRYPFNEEYPEYDMENKKGRYGIPEDWTFGRHSWDKETKTWYNPKERDPERVKERRQRRDERDKAVLTTKEFKEVRKAEYEADEDEW